MISRTFKFFIILFFLLSSLAGCKVGQKYQQPELNTPDSFRDAWGSDTSASKLYDISWKTFFNDTVLRTLIDSGLAHNYDMRIALKNMEIADRNLRINKLQYLPTVDANIATVNQQYRSKYFYGSASSKWYQEKGTNAPESLAKYQSQYATGLSFSWEADIWGRIAQEGDALKASWLNSQEAKTAIQTKLIADIATGYFNLLMLDAQIEVAKRNVQLNDSTLHMIKLQFDAGEITALALQQTESQRLLAASLVPDLEKEITIQENTLRMLVGDMPARVQREHNLDADLINFSDQLSLGSPMDVVRNRPDVRKAEYQLIIANAEMNITQIMRYPQISLNAVFGVNAMLSENWFNIPGALLGGFVGEISAPVFKGKKLKNKYEVAKIEREKTELAFQRQVMEAVAEVSNTLITVEKQKEQLSLAEQRVANSDLAVKNASLLFKSGYATYLEVITAQGNALRSELDLVALKQKQLNAAVALYRALGGGWK